MRLHCGTPIHSRDNPVLHYYIIINSKYMLIELLELKGELRHKGPGLPENHQGKKRCPPGLPENHQGKERCPPGTPPDSQKITKERNVDPPDSQKITKERNVVPPDSQKITKERNVVPREEGPRPGVRGDGGDICR